jgi:YbbR domain-containing protein
MRPVNGRKLLQKIIENWPAKVLSIALAIVLFMFHRMSVLENRFFSVPLHLELNNVLTPASSYPHMVRVSLRGEANSIFPILEEDIEAYLDLSRYNEKGNYRAPVQIRRRGTALGVEPLEISVDPLEIAVELDEKMSKYVPLKPNFEGYLESGYEMVSYTLTPTQVVVDGPRSLVEQIAELPTETIEIGGRSEDFTTTVHILNRDSFIQIRGDGMAEFRGFVKKLIMIRSFDDLPVMISGLDDKFTTVMEVTRGSIRIEGNQDELEYYNPASNTNILTLDCSGITEAGSYTLPVQADIPAMFTLIRSDPTAVTIQVREK